MGKMGESKFENETGPINLISAILSAVERAMTGTDLNDCREALVNAASDALHAFNKSVGQRPQCLLTPINGQLKYFVLFVLGLLKNVGG